MITKNGVLITLLISTSFCCLNGMHRLKLRDLLDGGNNYVSGLELKNLNPGLNWGSTFDEQDENGDTVLHIMARSWMEYSDPIGYALGRQASPIIKNNQGDTPLFVAVKEGHWEKVQLFARSVDVIDVKNNSGLTPLHHAILHQNARVVEELLKQYPNLSIKDDIFNVTPIELVALMQQYGAKEHSEGLLLGKETFNKIHEALNNSVKLDSKVLEKIESMLKSHEK